MLAPDKTWSSRDKLRAVVFVVVAVFVVGGPFYRQVLKGRNKAFRNWVMFNGKATGFVDATFYRERAGEFIEVDRYEALGQPKTPKSRYWLLKDKRVFERLTRVMCSKAGNDLRVDARIATRRGWKPLMSREEMACQRRAR